jgi:hypothetical protein
MMCETCGQPSNTVVCDSCNTTSKGMTNRARASPAGRIAYSTGRWC